MSSHKPKIRKTPRKINQLDVEDGCEPQHDHEQSQKGKVRKSIAQPGVQPNHDSQLLKLNLSEKAECSAAEETVERTVDIKPANEDEQIRNDDDTSPKDDDIVPSRKKKEKTPGVIYLSSIPEGMQYNDVHRVFSELGDIGRISLQIGGPQPHHAKQKRFAEGWVEFLDKKRAKRCVLLLNNQLVGGKKRSKWYDCIWHMRYLPKFHWTHLTERLVYEQASTQQRMRTEISQARQEAQHFAEQIEFKQRDTRMASKHADWKQNNKRTYEYTQKVTDDEIRKRKVGSERVRSLEKARSNVLGSLFGQGLKPE